MRYLVAGGVAVNAYGYQRLTQGLDLVLELESTNILTALQALAELGYRPMVPVKMEEFADPAKRKEWIEQRNMRVFSLASDLHPDTVVDIFASEPFDFRSEHASAEVHEIAPGVSLPLVRLPTLIAMKQVDDRDWDAATWEGSRRAQVRRSLRLTVRERLEALEAMAETSRVLSKLGRRRPGGRGPNGS